MTLSAKRVAIACVVGLAPVSARAQAIKCSAFLHNADGSWRSFESATIIGSHGPVRIDVGEIVRRGDTRDKADIAKILDGLCG